MDEIRTDIGVIVGRFQVPKLHEAHIELIDRVVANHPKVIIFLGLAPIIGTRRNPLDFDCRKMMIQEMYPNITIMYIKDVRDDRVWDKVLDKQIGDLARNKSVTLYGGRKGFISRYKGKYKTVELEAKSFVSGSEIRKKISQAAKNSEEFRIGAIWLAHNQYPKTYATVDVAILNENGEVLLGRKPDETLFQFPGGFSTPESKSFEEDATRENNEETGSEIGFPEYIGSAFIDDWRYRDEVDKVKTLFFKAQFIFGGQPGEDELAETKWFKIEDLNESNLQDFHIVLLKMLRKNLGMPDLDKVSKDED